MATTTFSAPVFVDATHVQVTKAFAKNSRVYGTDEFKMWRELLKEVPDAVMVTKSIKKNPNKVVDTRNMTYEHMAMYIRTQDNATKLMVTFEKTVMQSKVQNNPYRYVLAWFMQQFPKANEYKSFFEERAAEAKKQKNIFYIEQSANVEVRSNEASEESENN